MVVDILASPEAYARHGVTLPKGILMHGQPGTGKTLMVRALANEMKIPFYPVSSGHVKQSGKKGSGLTLEALFEKAASTAPSVILIDELDSFLEQHGPMQRNDVLLNQLLTLMDGFYQNKQVMVIATTNDIRSIPHSLLRPGRFDRKIQFDLPSLRQRKDALKTFLRYTEQDEYISLERIAHMLEFTTIAEIKHIVSESILTAIKSKTPVKEETLLDAYDRYQLGITKKEETRTPTQIKRIAVHEVGHAMVHYQLGCFETIARISIARKTGSKGHVRMVARSYMDYTQTDLLHKIASFLGGYAAEQAFYQETSTGAAHDIERASTLAKDMVTELGMSPLGPRRYPISGGFDAEQLSNEAIVQIEQAVQDILDKALNKAQTIIYEQYDLIEHISTVLIEKKVLTNQDFLMFVENTSAESNNKASIT